MTPPLTSRRGEWSLSAQILLRASYVRFNRTRRYVSGRERERFQFVVSPHPKKRVRKFACAECSVRRTREARLIDHARDVHGLTGRALKKFKDEVTALNAPGTGRKVRTARLLRALKSLPVTATPKMVAREVLKVSNVTLVDGITDSSGESESEPEVSTSTNSPFLAWKDSLANFETAADLDHDPAPPRAPADCRRMPKAVIGALGVSKSYGDDPVVQAFELAYSTNQQVAQTTCKQRAGLLYRFLSYSRQFYPELDDLTALCSQEVSTAYIDVLRSGGFKSRSLLNHIDSCRAALAQLTISKPVQIAFGYHASKRREIERSASHWGTLKAHAFKQAASDQRRKMLQTPLSDWSDMYPVTHTLDYLNLVREAMIDAGEHNVMPVPGRNPGRAQGRSRLTLDLATLRSACGLAAALSGCRLGVLLNLTRLELSLEKKWQGIHVLSVKNHKTARYHGDARILLRPHQLRMYELLAAKAAKEAPAQADYVFGISPKAGRASEIVFGAFNTFLAGRLGQRVVPRPFLLNNARKACETFKYLLSGSGRDDQCGAAARRAITSFLMHTDKTSGHYYVNVSLGDIVNAFRSLNSLIAILALLELIRDKRITFKELEISRQGQ